MKTLELYDIFDGNILFSNVDEVSITMVGYNFDKKGHQLESIFALVMNMAGHHKYVYFENIKSTYGWDIYGVKYYKNKEDI